MTSVLKALALYNNEAEDSDELSFKINDLLIVIQENFQDGWHLCQRGDKRGVAPANYLQILVKPMPSNHSEESIYDCPRSNNNTNNSSIKSPEESDIYVYSDYQNMQGNDPDDIYMNTSGAAALTSLNDSRGSQPSLHPSPKRPAPPQPPKINYPAAPVKYNLKQILQHQTSEYMDMDSVDEVTDYSEIADEDVGNEYDEVPSNDAYDSGAINNSSNESMKSSSSQIYPTHRSNDSIHSTKVSSESIKSYDSGISSSRQENSRRDSPPSIPRKQGPSHPRRQHTPKHSDSDTPDIYMVPPAAAAVTHPTDNKRRSDHDYFAPPTTPTKPLLTKKSSREASEVVMLDEAIEYARASQTTDSKSKKLLTPTMEKKKKKSTAGVDKLLSNLTLKKNKNSGGGGLAKSQTLSKSLEHINKHGVVRPLPHLPVCKTEGESSRGPHQKRTEYRERPLPPTPPDLEELQDYAEIEDGPEYVDIQTPSSDHPQDTTRVSLERQRSKSVTGVLNGLQTQERRHSSPARRDSVYDGCSYVTHDPAPPPDDQDDFHDYTEVPDLDSVPSSYHSNSSGYHSNASSVQSNQFISNSFNSVASLHNPETQYRPPLPTSHPPPLPPTEPSRAPPQPPKSTAPSLGGQPGGPAMATQCPATGTQIPATGVQSPAMVVQSPAMVVQSPATGVQSPATRAQHTQKPVAHVSPVVQVAHGSPVRTPVLGAHQVRGIATPTPPTVYSPSTHQVCGIATPTPPTFYSPSTLAKLPVSTYERAEPVSPSDRTPRAPSYSTPHRHPVILVEIDISSLCEQDRTLIREHCGTISSSLLRATTESLIKLKYVTDNRDIENYVLACTATGGACIEIIKHLTVLADRCQNADLYNLTFAHKTKLREIVKRLVEAVKVAKVQFPANVAHDDMLARRNELITAIREVKTFVVKLLHPPT